MANGKFGGGAGVTSSPYLIEDAEDLNAVRFNPTASYKLDVSINLGIYPYNTGKGWVPIQNFSGTFDGNGKKIQNLYINRPTKDYCGLFEKVIQIDNFELNIFDLCVENANVTGGQNVGILAGALQISQTTGSPKTSFFFERCYVTGKVKASNYGGGLIGQLIWLTMGQPFNFAQDCFIDVELNPTSIANNFGALAGYINNANTTQNIIVKYVISACTFSNIINGTETSGLAPRSFGVLKYGALHANSTACYYDSDRWGNYEATPSVTGKTTKELLTKIDNFDKRILDNNKLVWSYVEGLRYPMLNSFLNDRFFVKTSKGYCVYSNGNWVISYTNKPTRKQALQGMENLKDIPFSAWNDLRKSETSIEIINVVELSNGTTQQIVTTDMTLDEDASAANDDNNYFTKEITFSDFGHGIVSINKGVVV